MPTEIQIPSILITILQVILAFGGAFFVALWLSLIVWTFRDARSRSRDIFAILLATLMVTIFGPLGLILYFLLRPPVTLAELYERSLEEEALLQDLEERPRCPGCSRQVNEAWIVCPDCHTTLKQTCPTCSRGLDLTWSICPYCGTAVTPVTSGSDDPDHSGSEAKIEPTVTPVSAAGPHGQTRPLPTPAADEGHKDSPARTGGDETRPNKVPEAGAA